MGMRPHRTAIALPASLAVLVLAAACGSPPPTPTPTPVALDVAADAAQLVAADDRFGLDLLASTGQNGNVALSPASVAIALQMVAAGARGQTATELAHVLHLSDARAAATSAQALLTGLNAAENDSTNTLKVSNTVWTQQGLPVVPAFTKTLQDDFASSLRNADFARDPDGARRNVNDTVSGQTDGMIPQLFPPGSLDAATSMVLTNAIYLKATWAWAFPTSDTRPGPFHRLDGSVTQVPMMNSDTTGHPADKPPYGYATGPGYQAVTLPYTGGKLAFTVLLPTSSLQDMTQSLRAKGLPAVLSEIRPSDIDVEMPKFTLRDDIDLSSTLKGLGMPDAFTSAADFSGISPVPLAIATVRHDAYVQVDEQGTTAAAATGIGIAVTSGALANVVTVNHPFLFVITDTATGAPLFLGRVTDPGA
jgi:serpin B